MQINVGDKIRFTPYAFSNVKESLPNVRTIITELTGTVIHVNESHQHYTVEAECRGYRIRECFKMQVDPNTVERKKSGGLHG